MVVEPDGEQKKKKKNDENRFLKFEEVQYTYKHLAICYVLLYGQILVIETHEDYLPCDT